MLSKNELKLEKKATYEGCFCPLELEFRGNIAYDGYAELVNIVIPNDFKLLFNKGEDSLCWQYMGAHQIMLDGKEGVLFAVWAPNVAAVYVLGDFNQWRHEENLLKKVGKSNVWAIFIPGAHFGQRYLYKIIGRRKKIYYKIDPFAFGNACPPEFNSRIVNIKKHVWQNQSWCEGRKSFFSVERPLNIYEAHLLSWKKHWSGAHWSYRELARELPDYVKNMGYTHLEMLPITEHPFVGSMGYQSTGYFSPTARLGAPEDLQYFVDACHSKGIGVILDFVAGHFCRDEHGLKKFTGSFCFESKERGGSFNRHWGTHNFNLALPEVRSFLLASADFWLSNYRIDGLRVDAVADTLDIWEKAGKGNEVYSFFQQLNVNVYKRHAGVIMAAEDSSARKMVTTPVYSGGLGFSHKWNMGWSFDACQYILASDHEKHWRAEKFFNSLNYAFDENFILPISHDTNLQNVFGSIQGKKEEKMALKRIFYMYMMFYPGSKLFFMGTEWGKFNGWHAMEELQWSTEKTIEKQFRQFVLVLHKMYLKFKSLEKNRFDACVMLSSLEDSCNGLWGILRGDYDDYQKQAELLLVINFMNNVKTDIRFGVPYLKGTKLRKIMDSNILIYGGKEEFKEEEMQVEDRAWGNYGQSINLKIGAYQGSIWQSVR